MSARLRKLARGLLWRTTTGKKLILGHGLWSYMEDNGWFRSVEVGLPVDREGNCLPWFTYPAISFLKGRIQSDMVVFEYGSGNSTLWWAEQVSSIISYEHVLEWFNSLGERMPSNVEYVYCELNYGGEYSRAILGYRNRFNIVVVDGRDRVNCAKNSLGALRGDGVIIWDNSDRDKYQDGYSYLMQRGFKRLDFAGLGPIGSHPWCTSIFYRDKNCLGV